VVAPARGGSSSRRGRRSRPRRTWRTRRRRRKPQSLRRRTTLELSGGSWVGRLAPDSPGIPTEASDGRAPRRRAGLRCEGI
jgi:hypothetical protein